MTGALKGLRIDTQSLFNHFVTKMRVWKNWSILEPFNAPVTARCTDWPKRSIRHVLESYTGQDWASPPHKFFCTPRCLYILKQDTCRVKTPTDMPGSFGACGLPVALKLHQPGSLCAPVHRLVWSHPCYEQVTAAGPNARSGITGLNCELH